MEPAPIYTPEEGRRMRVACFMSGSGTNTKKIISHSLEPSSKYKVTLIFTDVRDNRLKRSGEKMCRAKDIADRLQVNKSSVTGALRSLSEKVLVNYAPYDIITLTAGGEKLAKDIVRRHETLKDFFVKILLL